MSEQASGLGKLVGFFGLIAGLVVGWNATHSLLAALIAAAIFWGIGVSLGNFLHRVIAVGISILLILFSSYIRQQIIGAVMSPAPQRQSRRFEPITSGQSPSRPLSLSTPAKPSLTSNCRLYNDKSNETTVYIRSYCDIYDCDRDASRIIEALPDNTPIRLIAGVPRIPSKVRPFSWIEVEIIATGQTVWVADSKIKCG